MKEKGRDVRYLVMMAMLMGVAAMVVVRVKDESRDGSISPTWLKASKKEKRI